MRKHIISSSELLRYKETMLQNIMKWYEVRTGILPNILKVYGIPRGGVPVACLLQGEIIDACTLLMVDTPEEADFFVDDLYDSGTTSDRYTSRYNKPVFCLTHKQPGQAWIVFPWEETISGDDESGHDIITRLLQYIGEDTTREGLIDTPSRVVKSWDTLYGGYQMIPKEILSRTFTNDVDEDDWEPTDFNTATRKDMRSKLYDEMVILKDIEFYSTCEHHLLPFIGRAHVAYIPGNRVVGISKLARLVDCFARRLQIQERMTQQITQAIHDYLDPLGVGVIIEAQHLCMTSRGVSKQNSKMITTDLRGVFRTQPDTRQEFLNRCG